MRSGLFASKICKTMFSAFILKMVYKYINNFCTIYSDIHTKCRNKTRPIQSMILWLWYKRLRIYWNKWILLIQKNSWFVDKLWLLQEGNLHTQRKRTDENLLDHIFQPHHLLQHALSGAAIVFGTMLSIPCTQSNKLNWRTQTHMRCWSVDNKTWCIPYIYGSDLIEQLLGFLIQSTLMGAKSVLERYWDWGSSSSKQRVHWPAGMLSSRVSLLKQS